MNKIVIGTRGSNLARAQSTYIAALLRGLHGTLSVDERIIVTEGDKLAGRLPSAATDKGLFTRAIEQELIAGAIDLAIHSFKDLPTDLPKGLCIGAVLTRGPTEDVLIGPNASSIAALPRGACVGAGGIRRAAQMRKLRPDISVKPIQGNVDTRLKKLDNGDFDAIILAAAGLERLNLSSRIACTLKASTWYYAVGQGALAVEIRSDDAKIASIVGKLDHVLTRRQTEAERAFLHGLGGGCLVPVGVRGSISNQHLVLCGMVCGYDGVPFLEDEIAGLPENAFDIGNRLADKLLQKGAADVLASVRNRHAA